MSIVVATQGQASVTGTTSETNLASLRIPAGSIGRNGHVEVKSLWSYTNSANNKTLGGRLSTTGGNISGTSLGGALATTTATAQIMWVIRNNNATNSQTLWGAQPVTPFGSSANALLAPAIDTTQDTFINLTGTLALSTETLTLVHAYAVVFPAN